MGNSLTCCEFNVTQMSFKLLKEKMEGQRRQMRSKPDVFVTINEMTMKEGGQITFSPQKFTLKGLTADCTVEIIGSNAQIVQELGSEMALRLMEKVSIGPNSRTASELTGRVGNAAADAKKKVLGEGTSLINVKEREHPTTDRLSGSGDWDKGQETKRFAVIVTFSMSKDIGEEEVAVKIDDIDTTVKSVRSALRSENVKRYVQEILSAKASEVVTRKAKQKWEEKMGSDADPGPIK
mmetsp:Transcript_6129/g.11311  ORF Transcript_6129/g.11311 Transcript_6129/m.11311 type:complete len:237 (-) Transcript_6129:39-749(-)